MNRIFLIGYMGSGKTTLGRHIAGRLGYDFIDMDAYIEEKNFKSVGEIFATQGEEKFRVLERNALIELSEFESVVIATGGGTPCFFDNMEVMNRSGLTVYLHLTPEELAERLEYSHAGKRPLLADRKGIELLEFISAGLKKRETFYQQASYVVNGADETVVEMICEKFHSL